MNERSPRLSIEMGLGRRTLSRLGKLREAIDKAEAE